MSILSRHLVFVNEQVGIQNRLAKKYAKDERRAAIHTASRDAFIELLDSLSQADSELEAASASQSRGTVQAPVLTLRPDELDGLPPELLAELSEGAIPDKADTQIISVIDDRGGIATLDQIMVGLYRANKELSKRNTLTSKLYRMIQKGSLFAVPIKKGVYSTRRLTEEDARRIFGQEQEPQQQTLA